MGEPEGLRVAASLRGPFLGLAPLDIGALHAARIPRSVESGHPASLSERSDGPTGDWQCDYRAWCVSIRKLVTWTLSTSKPQVARKYASLQMKSHRPCRSLLHCMCS
jgi:hypothetical protein